MLLGDLLQVVAAVVLAAAVYLIVSALVGVEVGVGCALMPTAGSILYIAEVHGGVPLREKRAESS